MNAKRYLPFLLLTTLAGCIEPVDLPIRQVERRLVVDGLITDEAPPYPIKLTYSGNLSRALLIPDELAINGAVASIEDDAGNRAPLIQDPLNPAFYWMRDARLRGRAGRRYTLRVLLPDGQRYVSVAEPMPAVPAIERLYGEYVPSDPNTAEFNKFLVKIDTRDPAGQRNFYRWQALSIMPVFTGPDPLRARGSILYRPYYGSLTNVLSDQLIDGNRLTGRLVLSPPLVGLGSQYVEVRQYSLSPGAYDYWVRYEQQLSRTGTLFDAQPASIEGNVRTEADTARLALGYFGASAVSRRRIIMSTDSLNYDQFVTRFQSILSGQIQLRLPGFGPGGSLGPPQNWLTYGQ